MKASTQAFSCQCCEVSKNNFFHRTAPLVAFVSTQKGIRAMKAEKKEGSKEKFYK